jgi:hypothetical protein
VPRTRAEIEPARVDAIDRSALAVGEREVTGAADAV